jgi:hypothetical protein
MRSERVRSEMSWTTQTTGRGGRRTEGRRACTGVDTTVAQKKRIAAFGKFFVFRSLVSEGASSAVVQ